MATQKIEILIEGGKATAAPPLGPALGPTGVNIGQVVADINTKTADFKGMQVPVTVEVDADTKTYSITLGTPPASALIKQEAGVKTGQGDHTSGSVGNLSMEQVVKIARMKESSLLGATLKARAKEIVGTAMTLGVTIEGAPAREATKAIDAGAYDTQLR